MAQAAALTRPAVQPLDWSAGQKVARVSRRTRPLQDPRPRSNLRAAIGDRGADHLSGIVGSRNGRPENGSRNDPQVDPRGVAPARFPARLPSVATECSFAVTSNVT